MPLGNETAAIATLLAAIGITQASLIPGECDLSDYPNYAFGIAASQTDRLFNALTCPTVIGRLTYENPANPSAIIMNRLNSASGAPCVQVAFTDPRQVPYFIAASNWIATLSANTLGQMEYYATVKHNLRRVGGGYFAQRATPFFAVSGRGTIPNIATIQRSAANMRVRGAGTVTVSAGKGFGAGTLRVAGAGTVTVDTHVTRGAVEAIHGAGQVSAH